MPTTRRLFLRLAASALTLAGAFPARSEVAAQLARTAAPDIDPRGFLVSEKLDGVRALWDGERSAADPGLPPAGG